MVTIGVTPYNELEVLLFTIAHKLIKFPCWGRILGIKREIGRTSNQTFLCLALVVFLSELLQGP
jgi:hypothetical protein